MKQPEPQGKMIEIPIITKVQAVKTYGTEVGPNHPGRITGHNNAK